jgi:hypothetical protein
MNKRGTNYSLISLLLSNFLVVFYAISNDIDLKEFTSIFIFQSVIMLFFGLISILSLKNYSVEGIRFGNSKVEKNLKTKLKTAMLTFLIIA